MKNIVKNNLINLILLTFLESTFAIIMFDTYSRETIISSCIHILFSSFIITLLTSLFNRKVNRIIHYIIITLICIIFGFHFVLKTSFDTFMSLSFFTLTDQATGFLGEAFKIIFRDLYGIVFFFIPLILLIIFRKKINYETVGREKLYLLIYLILIPLSYCSYRLYIGTRKDNSLSIYDLYYNVNNNNLNVQKLGVLSSFELDIYRTIFGFEEKVVQVNFEEKEDNNIYDYGKNTLLLDLDDNIDSNIRMYIDNNPGSNKNKYTGVFENKNLIYIVAESFSNIAVREDITPTLYKLTNNGFVYNNFYVPYYLSTIGGEFQALTGLFPDGTILGTWRSGKNSFPYGLANSFTSKGYNTYAYHDHSGYFQDRYKYVASLGFTNFKACYMGLNIDCDLWPESDIEMIEKTYSDYINSDKPFMTYYMTVSGHMDYDFDGSNMMSNKNKELVDNLNYTDTEKAYLATQIELDRALELLINKLEENNKLDDTVIILLADHYPYALTMKEINDLSDYNRDSLFEINHNSLIIWNNKLKRQEFDKVGMSLDVIPTIYNLFGIDYDSRIFAGTDLFSDSEGLVILGNRSWITDKGRYNSTTNEYVGTGDNDYVTNINNLVQNKVAFSKNILLKNGYKYINKKNN